MNSCIITFPLEKAGLKPTSDLVNLLCPLSNKTYLITGNYGFNFFEGDKRIKVLGVHYSGGHNLFLRSIRQLCLQITISFKLLKTLKEIDIVIFFIGDYLLLPSMVAKLFNKKLVFVLAGSVFKSLEYKGQFQSEYNNLFFECTKIFVKNLTNINYRLSDNLVVYSRNLITEWDLEKFKDKISIGHRHFVNFEKFRIKKKFQERENLIGFVGRLDGEKGVLNFCKSISMILKKKPDFKFVIIGDGLDKSKIEKYIINNNLSDKIRIIPWIEHDKLPKWLNEFKLLVLPSYTEGLPNIMLEAMACGVPFLGTSVGSISDIIIDGKNGFIMDNNSPECITMNVLRVLKYPDLDDVIEESQFFVKDEFDFNNVLSKWNTLIANIMS